MNEAKSFPVTNFRCEQLMPCGHNCDRLFGHRHDHECGRASEHVTSDPVQRCVGCGKESPASELVECGNCDRPVHLECSTHCDSCLERTCNDCMAGGSRDDVVCLRCTSQESWERAGPTIPV